MKLCQSARDLGAKILVPVGQLFFCEALCTSMQLEHFKSAPGENGPVISTLTQLQPAGLPVLGVVEIFWAWQ